MIAVEGGLGCWHHRAAARLLPQPHRLRPDRSPVDEVIATIKAQGLVPFLDMAYQGFGNGIAEDGKTIIKFLDAGLSFFVSTSFSKSFSLYGERVGAVSIVSETAEESTRVLSQSSA